jgi:hypothetical protein
MQIAEDAVDFSESGDDGIISIPIKFTCTSLTLNDYTFLKFRITVDGIDLYTDFIQMFGK